MQKENKITFSVFGRRALFTTPESKLGGEKFSYHIPTYESLVGMASSIYWKPTIQWIIDRVRIIQPIQTETVGTKLRRLDGKSDLAYYTYLRNVEYEVEAHFEWNLWRDDLSHDRNENKHFFMAQRSLEKGGRRDVFLGTRECQGYAEPIEFGKQKGAYDQTPELSYGLSFHSFSYPDQNEKGELIAHFWHPTMEYGIITFPKAEECSVRRVIKKGSKKEFVLGQNLRSVEEEVEV
ncbi:MAG: type I-C CRISPR-associated protein Cas5c [Tissierellia bacterium]|nr:type I-C CRISPR-associated protein Cas5c [Tissierellia bacterium]